MIPSQHSLPLYRAGDILEDLRDGRRLLVLAVGLESYFIRVLDPPAPVPSEALEPVEFAWGHTGCEAGTQLLERP